MLPPLEASQRYGILAGGYKKYRDAEKMLAKLKNPENSAFIQRDPRDINLYQAWLGLPFTSQSEAEQTAKSLVPLSKNSQIETIENPVPK